MKQAQHDHFSGEKSETGIKSGQKPPFLLSPIGNTTTFFIHQGKGERREVDSVQAADVNGFLPLGAIPCENDRAFDTRAFDRLVSGWRRL
jgi:hypothetical protein